jgi:hypothetical protein
MAEPEAVAEPLAAFFSGGRNGPAWPLLLMIRLIFRAEWNIFHAKTTRLFSMENFQQTGSRIILSNESAPSPNFTRMPDLQWAVAAGFLT